jgi:hypothetical protein
LPKALPRSDLEVCAAQRADPGKTKPAGTARGVGCPRFCHDLFSEVSAAQRANPDKQNRRAGPAALVAEGFCRDLISKSVQRNVPDPGETKTAARFRAAAGCV